MRHGGRIAAKRSGRIPGKPRTPTRYAKRSVVLFLLSCPSAIRRTDPAGSQREPILLFFDWGLP